MHIPAYGFEVRSAFPVAKSTGQEAVFVDDQPFPVDFAIHIGKAYREVHRFAVLVCSNRVEKTVTVTQVAFSVDFPIDSASACIGPGKTGQRYPRSPFDTHWLRCTGVAESHRKRSGCHPAHKPP